MLNNSYSLIKNLKKILNSIFKSFGLKPFFKKQSYLLPLKSIYSQYGQDYFISDILYRKKPGYYVDVGARCGKIISNTFHLEKQKWKGICIEPHPELYEKLKKNRNCLVANYAISDIITNDLEFVKFLEEPFGHSGLLTTFRNPQRLDKIHHEIISVKTIDLTKLLDELNAPKFIEYLDIDVEGHELLCLNGIDYKKYKFGVIGVETTPKMNNYNDIKSFLSINNYKPFAIIGSDTFFIQK